MKINQKHFLWTTPGPISSYSAFVIQILENSLIDESIEAPIQAENFLSGGAITLIFILEGANATTSLFNLN